MSEHKHHHEDEDNNESQIESQDDMDVVGLLKKIQQQLNFLEKKVDSLIQSQGQPSERSSSRADSRPSYGDRNFSRPYRSYGSSNRSYGGSSHGNSSRYERPDRDSSGRLSRGFSEGRRFEKHAGADSDRGFSHKKRPSFHKRKDRE